MPSLGNAFGTPRASSLSSGTIVGCYDLFALVSPWNRGYKGGRASLLDVQLGTLLGHLRGLVVLLYLVLPLLAGLVQGTVLM